MALIVLLFIILPFVELTLLLQIGSEIGALNTIGIVIATGIVGGYLAKREGLSVWLRFQAKMASGSLPGSELLDGMIILASGALLVTPGVITDAIGLMGLLPPTRALIKQQLRKRISVKTMPQAPPRPTRTDGKVDISRIVEQRSGEAG